MKPDWKDAPEWANWLAMDSNGEWNWFKNEPYAATDLWSSSSRMESAQSYSEAWYETLEKRPKIS
jgi:hypothetical protein